MKVFYFGRYTGGQTALVTEKYFILLSYLSSGSGPGENLFNLFNNSRTLQQSRMINYREEEKRILDEILGKGVYDNRIRPSGTNGTGNFTIIQFPR